MLAGVAALALLAGCTGSGGDSSPSKSSSTSSGTSSSTSPGPSTTTHEIGPASIEVFGGLTVRLVFEELTVESGDQLPNRLQVENTSGHPVTDPGCVLGATAAAIIPADDPEAELWMQTIVDCEGPFEFPDGSSDEWDGPRFIAATPTGEPLPPGDYIAAVEIDGQRLEYPVEVTEQVGEPQPIVP
ncbi:MAG: hypothetical protein M5U31_08595 [Acidimicrobiia bacterium]|nr:hypothetical protein [Acidimicrobiia bacterium]